MGKPIGFSFRFFYDLIDYYKKALKYVVCEHVCDLNELRISYTSKAKLIDEIEGILSQEINDIDFENLKDEFQQCYIECELSSSSLFILNFNLKEWIKTGDSSCIYFENYLFEKIIMKDEIENFIIKKSNSNNVRKVTDFLSRYDYLARL